MKKSFVPALHFGFLTRFYDPFMGFTGRETFYRHQMNELGKISDFKRVLDVGCGTGTQIILIKKNFPAVEVSGLDIDTEILTIARKKISKSGFDIGLIKASASVLPFGDNSFECVQSSLIFHHLSRKEKIQAMSEIFRVLRPGGYFTLADIGRPHTRLMRFFSFMTNLIERSDDNVKGMLPVWMGEVGFIDVSTAGEYPTSFGTVAIYRGKKPVTG
jgi:ubiquinone/menaquinone biosynthesis C-methylase UbiE